MRVRAPGDADRPKVGDAVTVSVIAVVFVRAPEVPVIVTVAVPVAAELFAVSVNVLEDVAGLGLNEAVTPLGRPEAVKLTLPVKPFCGMTVIVLVPLAPVAMLRTPGDAERAKFAGAAETVKAIGLLQFMLGATHTASGPEVAPEGIVMVMEVAFQELMVTGTPLRATRLLP